VLAGAAVALVGGLAYWPALDNPFIADDYAFFVYADNFLHDWHHLAGFPLGWHRLVANLFFALCFRLFGFEPAGYYAASLFVHLLNAALVALLVREVTTSPANGGASGRMAFVAALFFAAYERPQEAVFWITASHELFLATGALATAFFYARWRRTGRAADYAAALAAFVFAAFSKESFVVIPALLLLIEIFAPVERRPEASGRAWLAQAPFWLLAAGNLAYFHLWQTPDPWYGKFYGLTPHFLVVYPRSVGRLLFGALVFAAAGLVVERSRARVWLKEKTVGLWLAWLLAVTLPYSLVLYVNYLPSRHNYLPSVGVAGLVAFFFVRAWERAGSRAARAGVAAVLVVALAANVVALRRKDRDYGLRAQPTEQLITLLNLNRAAASVVVYDFPYESIVSDAAAKYLTPFDPKRLRFRKTGDGRSVPPGSVVLRWRDDTHTLELMACPGGGLPGC